VTRPAAWSEAEQIAICSAYAVLLDAQNNELTVNKAELCRQTLPALVNRSRGSYEFKMCNISAALADTGNAYVTGYKPRSGYQRSLLTTLHQLRPDLVNCRECGKFYDDNPGETICKTCADWVVTK
jgi:hypothetical protein